MAGKNTLRDSHLQLPYTGRQHIVRLVIVSAEQDAKGQAFCRALASNALSEGCVAGP